MEALAHLPRYARFLKELLMNKRILEEVSTITLRKECSTIISNRIPRKEKDQGGFIIPCTIGGILDEKALSNLGASINLMPYKIFQNLELGELKLIKMTLQLADCSVHHPMAIFKYVLVKLDRFIVAIHRIF
ncbi:uncharacterized protein LOC120281057 [Dioscorea cayenensis subsp. rotundata]|uniref:Uncharacterized protein LOC120281057 n=1 Tax=Dioscorea cayennensis subsp. rotundata TaxID=55577 RepID=A0AB40CVD9_DIOCR|nr:uncharacterized protein LOC120281057 [Dioscorea cayenensis subsp. rotundata]